MKLKVTEEQYKFLKEFMDMDGSIIDGDYIDSNMQIKTAPYDPDREQRPQTTDDYAIQATTISPYSQYSYYGYSVHENEDKNLEEDIYNSKDDREMISNTEVIPSYKELSKAYEMPQLQSSLQDMITQLSNIPSSNESKSEIEAIVLKTVLRSVDYENMPNKYKAEIKKYA